MKDNYRRVIFLLFFIVTQLCFSQYTEVINSNRPGNSMSAFSVGKRVIQAETGVIYKSLDHKSFNNSTVDGYAFDFTLRYGLLFEQLELIWNISYQFDRFTNTTTSTFQEYSRKGMLYNLIGAKYMIFDPIANSDRTPDIRSWDANHGFHWKDLIPAIGLYAGINLNLGATPYDYNNQFNIPNNAFYVSLAEPKISPKVGIITQSNFSGYWVLVTNVMYNRLSTEYPEIGFVLTLTHTFPKRQQLSVFVEDQGIKSDIYADNLLKGGFAYLFSKNFQMDIAVGGSLKSRPGQLFAGLGLSYRLDFHRDELKTSEEKSNKELSGGKKKKIQKKKKKQGLEKIEEKIEEDKDE